METLRRDLHRVVGTVIIYRPDQSYLITKRSKTRKVFPGKWVVPGGGLEVDDYINDAPTHGLQWYGALEKALRRELREEVNVEVGKLEYLLDLVFIRPDKIPVLTLSFYAPYKSGEVKINDESEEFAWIRASDVSKFDFIEGVDEEIEMVEKIISEKLGFTL